MAYAHRVIARLLKFAKRPENFTRKGAWLAALALSILLPTTGQAQTLGANFGLVRGTTTQTVCFVNPGYGTYWLTGSSTTNPAFVVSSAPSVFGQYYNVCFAVKFNPVAATPSGANSGTITVNYLQSEYLIPIAITINASAQYSKPSKGYVAPKYKVIGVTYAPPGRASNVSYGASSRVGNTTTLASSFTVGTGTSYSASLNLDISKWIPSAGVGAKVGGSSSTDFSVTSSYSQTATIEKVTSLAYQTNGPSCATCDNNISVDHNYDVVWIWLNPLHLFTTYSLEPKVVQWNGYGWNPKDPVSGMDVYPVLVGYLNGTWPTDPTRGVGAKLARAWAATGEVWQPGEVPALTCADKGAITKTNPFAAYLDAACVRRASAYVMDSPFPVAGATTRDKRFTRLSVLPTVNYAYGSPITNLSIQNINTLSVSTGVSTTYTQSYSYDVGFKLSAWIATLESNSTKKYYMTTTNSVSNTLTRSSTSSSSIVITPPTDPIYPGYTQFAVFQDNLYGTFAFYPVPGS